MEGIHCRIFPMNWISSDDGSGDKSQIQPQFKISSYDFGRSLGSSCNLNNKRKHSMQIQKQFSSVEHTDKKYNIAFRQRSD